MTGHTVRHVGPSTNPHRCSVRDCGKVATYAIGAYEFCTQHRPAFEVTGLMVRQAKQMMHRRGWSLSAIAGELHVTRRALDEALWRNLGDTPEANW